MGCEPLTSLDGNEPGQATDPDGQGRSASIPS
jgi:hypothetical protein